MTDLSLYKTRGQGKLKLKKGLINEARKRKRPSEDTSAKDDCDMDSMRNGGWKWVTDMTDLKGSISLQIAETGRYLKSLDNGTIVEGESHAIGEGPSPQEILMIIPIENTQDNTRFALKTGFNRYITAKAVEGKIIAKAEAIAGQEQWKCKPCYDQPGCFFFEIFSVSLSANKPLKIRMSLQDFERKQRSKKAMSEQETPKNLKQFEENQVKMYQKFQDKKLKLHPGRLTDLHDANKQGYLHEKMLDRREKMKSDRYCK